MARLTFKKLRSAARGLLSGELFILSSSLSFTTVLALVPTFVVVISALTAFGSLEREVHDLKWMILHNLAPGASDAVLGKIDQVINKMKLRGIGTLGFAMMLLTSTWLVMEVDRAIRMVWRSRPRRRFPWRVAAYWLVLFGAPLVAVTGLLLFRDFLAPHLMKAVFYVYAFIWLAGIYFWAPRVTVRFSYALVAAFLVTLAVAISQDLYIWFNAQFFAYNEIYGVLAAFPILMIWIRILWTFVLMGAALTRNLQG